MPSVIHSFIIFIPSFVHSFCALAQPSDTLWLSGRSVDDAKMWQFAVDGGMRAEQKGRIAVPSQWEQQGFGSYTYGRYYKTPGFEASKERGTYTTTFTIPKRMAGRVVELVFEGCMTDTEASIDGNRVGPVHQGGFTTFRYDVTPLVTPGRRHTLTVRVSKHSADKSVNAAERRADWWLFGGIYRPVYLRLSPRQHIRRADIDARADGELRIRLHTADLQEGTTATVQVDQLAPQSVPLSANDSLHCLTTHWQGISTWNPECTNLHDVTIRLADKDGTVVHELRQRVGFRTIEFRRKDGFYLNGQKLLIKGVNRHCFHPDHGRAPSRSADLHDLREIKRMNANAIRSHYQPHEQLLSLCDSLGLLYFCELAGWQNAYSTPVGRRMVEEMVGQVQNHPCIIMWGNGNEGGFNTALDTLFAQHDLQQRHVVHPWAQWNGVDAHHYPASQTGVGRMNNGAEVFLPTEFLHAQYDKGGGASLDDYWHHWQQSPLFAGGFIWAWKDEGVARSDKGGEIDTDGGNAPDGLVGPHGEREGSWYTVRDVWSPLQVEPLAIRPGWNGRFIVRNEFLFSSLDNIKLHYEAVTVSDNAERIDAEGMVELPQLEPGTSGYAHIADTQVLADADFLRLVATGANADTIDVWSFPLRTAEEYALAHEAHEANTAATGTPVVADSTLSCGTLSVTFNTTDGTISRISNGGRIIPLTNGPLPVGMKAKLQSITPRQYTDKAQLVMHYVGALDSIVWTLTPDGRLHMDALMLNRRDGGGYEGEFFDQQVGNLGLTFSYPESVAQGMQWMGKGPYRVWRNRQRGTTFGLWQKDYNNTITGQGKLVYPEFKGYHAGLYWARMQSGEASFSVQSLTDGLYYRVFTPEEPAVRQQNTMEPFPSGDLSFLFEIPAMRSYKPIEQLGPQAQPSHIRINRGDEGLRMRLVFGFNEE